jgi:tRNA modification GTPase
MPIHLDDTIAALATPPGIGALGVIRISGPDAFAIADSVFRGRRLSQQPANTVHYGKLTRPQQQDAEEGVPVPGAAVPGSHSLLIDEVVAILFRAPRSFTGEDIVEFSCHGSPYVLSEALRALYAAGARPALPGEFTQRAFLHGKMDLTQAEAVADLIASRTAAAQQAALYGLRGGFSARLMTLREQLLKFSALMELELDFSEEDVEFADRTALRNLLDEASEETRKLVESFALGNAVKEGVAVALIGKPNAGKSTLLNALLGEDRALVSEIAGTTRDTVEETMNVGGLLFRFVDTAGIRSDATDAIEAAGIERSRKKAQEAAAIVYVLDRASYPLASFLAEEAPWLQSLNKPVIIAANKADLPPADAEKTMPFPVLSISAKAGNGIDELKEELRKAITGDRTIEEGTVTNARHHAALRRLLVALQDVRAGMDTGLPGDLIALDLRQALHYIGEITGAVTAEDTLDAVFSKFCIGK